MTDLPYTYADADGDYLRIGKGAYTAYDPSAQQAVSVNTPTGEDAVAMARAVLAAAGDTGHRVISTEDLARFERKAAEVGAGAAARSMRDRAAEVADQPAEWSRLESPGDRIRALPLLADDENPVDPQDKAPRDTELIQQVRALVKRYGAPWVAYEAARQARH